MSKKNSQFPQNQSQSKQQVVTQTIQASYSSPYPLPGVLEAYEKLAPGSAKEIIEISRRTVESNIERQDFGMRAAVAHERRVLFTIQMTLGISIPGAFLLAFFNKDTAAYVFLFGELAALIGAFLYSKRSDKRR
jgi:uncharacterized membrane protein